MTVLGGGGVLLSEVPLYRMKRFLRGGCLPVAQVFFFFFFFITLKPRVESYKSP